MPHILGIKLLTLLPILGFLAEAATGVLTDQWGPLINLGAVGCVLAWFMFRTEPRLRRMEQAIDRSSRALMIVTMSIRRLAPEIKEQAESLISELEDAKERQEK